MDLMLRNLSTTTLRKKLLLYTPYFPLGLLVILQVISPSEVQKASFIQAFLHSYYPVLVSILLEIPILYYCAFEKRGTAWLGFTFWVSIGSMAIFTLPPTLTLLFGFLSSPSKFSFYLVEAMKTKFPEADINLIGLSFGSFLVLNLIVIFGELVLLRYRLAFRRRNTLFQYKNSLKNPEYRHSYAQIDRAGDLNELNTLFAQLQVEFPFNSRFLKLKYERKKASFEKRPLQRAHS